MLRAAGPAAPHSGCCCVQGHVRATSLPLPEALRPSDAQAVPRSGGSGGAASGSGTMAIVVTGACVAAVAVAVLAVVAWMLLQRGRARNLEPSDNLSKARHASCCVLCSCVPAERYQ